MKTVPLINALRLRFPRAEIAWFAEPEIVELLSNYSIVDRMIIAKRDWYKKRSGLKLIARRLRTFAPDLCFDLHGTSLSGMVTKLSKCPRRIGFDKDRASFSTQTGSKSRNLDTQILQREEVPRGRRQPPLPAAVSHAFFSNIRVKIDAEYEREENLQLLKAVGVVGCSIDCELPEISNEAKTFYEIARDFDIESTPYAIIGAGSQSGWTPGCFADVAEHLNQIYNMPVLVVWQNESERQFAESVVLESGGAVFLAPPLSFLQFVAVARRASLFVGEETDFLYLATAADTPSIGVGVSGVRAYTSRNTQNLRIDEYDHDEYYDEYAREVMQICHACDRLLKPLDFEMPEHLLYEYAGA
ncbi:MAG: hypothetical protein FWC50_01935 [Planctomycetaceae bacterium]|nr:hypothetical protein [Planctomycetaceae bacterium]